MGKTSLFPSLTLSTLDLKEVVGGSKVLHIKPSKFKCWLQAVEVTAPLRESQPGVWASCHKDFITGIQKVTSWHVRFPSELRQTCHTARGLGAKEPGEHRWRPGQSVSWVRVDVHSAAPPVTSSVGSA